jgi:hypothetical protein
VTVDATDIAALVHFSPSVEYHAAGLGPAVGCAFPEDRGSGYAEPTATKPPEVAIGCSTMKADGQQYGLNITITTKWS